MSIVVDDTIRAIVYCKFSSYADFMVAINEGKDGVVTGKGRIRWYREDTGDAFKDRDEKNWFESRRKDGTVEDILELSKKTLADLKEAADKHGFATDDPTYVLLRGDRSLDDFMDEFLKQPWTHKKTVNVQ